MNMKGKLFQGPSYSINGGFRINFKMNTSKKSFVISILVLFMTSSSYSDIKQPSGDSVPIVYSPNYNISVLGIEHFHPFDSQKYRKVFSGIIQKQALFPSRFYKPDIVTDKELLTVHTEGYINSLKKSRVIAQVVEIPLLRFLPACILRNGIVTPMKLATGGTILGAQLALRYGWAINLSGGYHHAKADKGEGFCMFADVPIALQAIWKEHPDCKALIIDLDAHQGNGNSSILGNDKRIAIMDMYNAAIYPNDAEAVRLVTNPIPLDPHTSTTQYNKYVSDSLPKIINDFQPGLIIYNAGTDIFAEDQLGNLSVTEEGIITRDECVFRNAIDHNIPILMVLSGGYHKKSGNIIAHSINNLINTFSLTSENRITNN